MKHKKNRVLIAGIGGASLGTEVLKSLILAGRYEIYGADISPLAFGHYQEGFKETFLIDRNDYVQHIKTVCVNNKIEVIVPGGEQPMTLLGPYKLEFESLGIKMAFNSAEVISLCSNKDRLFEYLQQGDTRLPKTIKACHVDDLGDFPCPCVIKPAAGSGGSAMVFLASTRDEALQYLGYVLNNTPVAVVQEYIPVDEGEFTIGVLSLPNGRLYGSIALKRIFNSKLSVLANTKTGLISSGYSQGLIDDFPDLCQQAEHISKAINSVGPVNIQARVRNGILLPFEINPRFSASTYLRALAGFNEIDIFLQYILNGIEIDFPNIRPGYYLRSLDEVYVPLDKVRQ
jgi:carbamoyl-phosphate synthase large subunit